MSDRKRLVHLTGTHEPQEELELFSDGETGSYRLFVKNPKNPHGQCIDLSLSKLRDLADGLALAVTAADRDPWQNPEHRRAIFIKEE